jgi:hypothetical protein
LWVLEGLPLGPSATWLPNGVSGVAVTTLKPSSSVKYIANVSVKYRRVALSNILISFFQHIGAAYDFVLKLD